MGLKLYLIWRPIIPPTKSDPIRSLYYFSSILMHLELKKWRNHLVGPFLPVGLSLAKWGFKPSESVLRHQTTFSWSSTNKYIYNGTRSSSFIVHTQNLCHLYVDFPIFTTMVPQRFIENGLATCF